MNGTRALSAAVMAPFAVAAVLWLPTPLLAALSAAIVLMALWEWAALSGLGTGPRRLALVTGNAAVMAALAWFGWPHLTVAVVLLGGLWWLLAAFWLGHGRAPPDPARLPATTRLVLKLMAGTLATLPAWAALALLHSDGPLGPRWALFALVLVWLADSGAYLVGSRFGRRRLAPRISPNKTWEGLWGGMAAALLIAPAALPALGLAWSQLPALLLLTGVAASFSVLGDLVESLLKRQAGSKDSGRLIPGHGGALDRVDSLLAALPAFALAKLWLQL